MGLVRRGKGTYTKVIWLSDVGENMLSLVGLGRDGKGPMHHSIKCSSSCHIQSNKEACR